MLLGKEAVKFNNHCKCFEPSLTLTWENNGTISGEFYSYCLNLEDGGRHHIFEANNEIELEKKLDHFIYVSEREITAISRKESVGCN